MLYPLKLLALCPLAIVTLMIGGGQVAVAQRLGHPAVTRTNGDFTVTAKPKRHLQAKASKLTTTTVKSAKASKLTTTTVKSAKSSKLCAKSSKSTKGGADESDSPILTIKPDDDVITNLINSGLGAPDTNYTFNLLADNIPCDLTEVTFQWCEVPCDLTDTSGLPGGPFSVVVDVSDDGTASTTFLVNYPDPGNFTITAGVLDGPNNLLAIADPWQFE